jgi:cysteine synthase A
MLFRPNARGLTGPKNSSLELIGNTSLVELKNIYPGPGRIFAKCEFLNPGGSIKDRTAKTIIERAYSQKLLTKGQTVVEMTSGNMGSGLALVCALTRNPFVAVMSAGNSQQRAHMLKGLGAEVILVPQVDGVPGQVTGADVRRAAAEAKSLAVSRGAYYVDQFHNLGSILAHKISTGPEIFEQTSGQLSAFVAVVGSGGTFCGTSAFLKSQNPRIRCVAVEPEGSEVIAGRAVVKAKHLIQGTGYGVVPPHWDAKLCDDLVCVSDGEVRHYTRELGTKEGLFVGFSSGANVGAAIKYLGSRPKPEHEIVVTVLCDTGMKYGTEILSD